MDFSYINLGELSVRRIYLGDKKIWANDYISLPEYSCTTDSRAKPDVAINGISASTNEWVVSSSDSWITATKITNNEIYYSITENTSSSNRTGYIYFKVDGETLATYEIVQTTQEIFIVVTPAFVNLQNGLATGGTLSVSSNTTNWTVSLTDDSSEGFTVEKYAVGSTYVVRWTVTENTSGEQRIAYILVRCDNRAFSVQINQGTDIYVLTGLTTNPLTVGNSQTQFSISLVSRFGQAITEAPSVSIGYNPSTNVQLLTTASGGTTGQWNFIFSCNANDTESQRTTTIVFTQPGSNKTLTYVVHQKGKQVTPSVPSIEGITTKAYTGNWILGTLSNNKVTVPLGTFDNTGIVVANVNPITEGHTATISMVYQNGPLAQGAQPTVYNKTDYEVSIPANSTITVSGVTYNAVWAQTPLPRLVVNEVTKFIVN